MWTSLLKRNDTVGTVWCLNIKVPWDVTFWGAFCRQTFLQDKYRMWWHYFENEAYNPECCIMLLSSIFNFHSNMVLPTLPTSGLTTCVKAFGRAGMVELHGSWTVGLPPSTASQRICCMCIFSAFLQNHGKIDWSWLICVWFCLCSTTGSKEIVLDNMICDAKATVGFGNRFCNATVSATVRLLPSNLLVCTCLHGKWEGFARCGKLKLLSGRDGVVP